MTFGELIQKYSWESIKDLFFQLYPDEIKRTSHYAKAYANLLKVVPLSTKYELNVKHVVFDKESNIPTGDVFGVIPDLKPVGDEFFMNNFALELTDWGEWISMPIDQSTMQRMTEEEIIVHCIFEMTWCGYTNKH